MSLHSSNFVSAVVRDQLMADFRRNNELLNVLLGGSASQRVLAQSLANGPAGGFARQLVLPLLEQAALDPTDGYSTISTFPSSDSNPDLSSAYGIPSDRSIAFNVNRTAIGTHFLPEIEQWTHASGAVLQDAKVAADLQEIRDQIEEAVVSDMTSSTIFASVSGSVGTKFPLVTTSEAALLADLKDLQGEMNRQDVPREGRWLVLPGVHEGLAVMYGGLSSVDYPGIGDRQEGRFQRIAGFNVIFTNSLASTAALAFHEEAYALVMPMGVQVESLRDKDRIGDYTRLYSVFGMGAVRETLVTAANGDADADSVARPGIVAITIT